MTGLMKRIFRRRAADQPPRRGVARLFRGRARGERLPGYKRLPSFGLGRVRGWLPWNEPAPPAAAAGDTTQETEVLAASAPSFQDRSRLRRRLRFLRRTRELGFRDVGGLIFDMRRFNRNRPDLLDAKLDALLAVDQELRSLERVLEDRRPIHELHEPGISACQRCGALHASEANFCPQCGLQISGPRAMGELGGAIAAPPKPPPPMLGEQDWSWPIPPPADRPTPPVTDQPTSPTVVEPDPDQPTIAYVPALAQDEPVRPPPVRDLSADEPREYDPARDAARDEPAPLPSEPETEITRPSSKRKQEPGRTRPWPREEFGKPPPEPKGAADKPPTEPKEEPGKPPPEPKQEPGRVPPGRKNAPKRPRSKAQASAQDQAKAPADAEVEAPASDETEPGEEPAETNQPPRASGGS